MMVDLGSYGPILDRKLSSIRFADFGALSLSPHSLVYVGSRGDPSESAPNSWDTLLDIPSVDRRPISAGGREHARAHQRQRRHPVAVDAVCGPVKVCHDHRVVLGDSKVTDDNIGQFMIGSYRCSTSTLSLSYGFVGQGGEAEGSR